MSIFEGFFFESRQKRQEREFFFKILLGCLALIFLFCVCVACIGFWFFLQTSGAASLGV